MQGDNTSGLAEPVSRCFWNEAVNRIAEKLGVPLELGCLTQQIFRRAHGRYGSQAQSPEVVRLLEQACGLELRADDYPAELVAK